MNLITLHDNAEKLAKWRKFGYGQNGTWRLTQVIPYKGTKTLLCQAVCNGETVEAEHVSNIQFLNIKFFDEPPSDGEYGTVEYKEEKYYYVKPTLENDVKIRCSCPDFTYRSAYWAWKAKVIFGGMPKPYKRKTKGKRKPVNPLRIPFSCKHIHQMQALVRTEGYTN